MKTEEKPRYCCPDCKKEIGLWESVLVQGWRGINAYLEPDGERDVDWNYAETDEMASRQVGCGECGWEGLRDELELAGRVGLDGKPLAIVHPDQMEI